MSRDNCGDLNCPIHGTISTRGRVFDGKVASAKAKNTIIIEREHYLFVPKYVRYERRHGRIPAHLAPCMKVQEGDRVRIAECRPISKTVSFVVISKMEGG